MYALSSVVSSYHDTLLNRRIQKSLSLPPHPFANNPSTTAAPAPAQTPKSSTSSTPSVKRVTPALPPASDHSRYTRYWTERSGIYRRASRALSTLNYLQLLMEMVTRRKGNDRIRWRVVLIIESVKYAYPRVSACSRANGARTCLRILIMGITRRPVLNPPTPQREFDLATISPDLLDEISGSFSVPSTESDDSNLAIKSVAPGAPLRSHLYPMAGALPESHLPHPLTLLPEMSASAMASEILTSTATLVHLLLLLRAQVRCLYPLFVW